MENMSDEEKKWYEEAKLYLTHTGVDDFNLEKHQSENRIWGIETILNLIEKQSKEIEHQKEKRENQKKELAILNEKQIEFNKLVNTLNSYKGQFKRQQKEIEELKAISQYREKIIKGLGLKTLPKTITGFKELIENNDKKWKDKIKAKIEELEKGNKNTFIRGEKILVLQSLLEKE